MYVTRHFSLFACLVACTILAGCATNRPEEVPATAVMVTEGTSRVTYTAPSHGMVYVWDADRDRVVYSGNIERDQTISIDPEKDRIMLDSTVASQQDLDRGNRFQVFYLRDRDVSRRVTIEHRERSEVREERPRW